MDFTVDMREKEKKTTEASGRGQSTERSRLNTLSWLDMTSCLQEKKEE